jgi:polysaccharide deacetylase family protein (PEP-CTERM system associated)
VINSPGTVHPRPVPPVAEAALLRIILSIDVEEHFRIESAAGLVPDAEAIAHYVGRLEPSTRWLLDQLDRSGVKATFFFLGQTARDHSSLVRTVHEAGHEIASHGWDHQRLHRLTPTTFRDELRRGREVLEQIIGEPVLGFRAPTFSLVRDTAWAVDVLAEEGLLYDSSIYPIWHDRYGVPRAPRGPFLVRGSAGTLLELPPTTWRLCGVNVPVGGGGYFRLLPLSVLEWALSQVRRTGQPPVTMLYFHPWEFDPEQRRLPLRGLSRFRTYVGMGRSRARLEALLGRHHFVRAIDVARPLCQGAGSLPTFSLLA